MGALSGNRIFLRTFHENDITDEYLAWLNDPMLMRFSNQRFRKHDRASSIDYLNIAASGDNLFFAIIDQDTGGLLGTIAARVSQIHDTADLGIMVGKREARGKGIGLEAWALMESYLFNTKRLRKITAGTLRINTSMVKLALSSGMHVEGIRKKQELVEGNEIDMILFAKFNNE